MKEIPTGESVGDTFGRYSDNVGYWVTDAGQKVTPFVALGSMGLGEQRLGLGLFLASAAFFAANKAFERNIAEYPTTNSTEEALTRIQDNLEIKTVEHKNTSAFRMDSLRRQSAMERLTDHLLPQLTLESEELDKARGEPVRRFQRNKHLQKINRLEGRVKRLKVMIEEIGYGRPELAIEYLVEEIEEHMVAVRQHRNIGSEVEIYSENLQAISDRMRILEDIHPHKAWQIRNKEANRKR